MYCINFQRSSLGVDYDRSRSKSQPDLYSKVKKQLKDFGVNATRRNDILSASICRNDKESLEHVSDDGEVYNFNQNPCNSPMKEVTERAKRYISRNQVSSMSELFPRPENEQREQVVYDPSDHSLLTRSFQTKHNTSTMKETGFEKSYENWQFERVSRNQRSPGRSEEKKEDFLDFESLAKSELDDHVGWGCNFSTFSDTREPTMCTPPRRNEQKEEVSFDEVQISAIDLSDQRLRSQLEQSRIELEIERNRNRELHYKLQTMENKLKDVDRSHSSRGSSSQIQKLEEKVVHMYRKELLDETKKREVLEAKLQESQKEKLSYVEQMDVLIFEYIPNVAPKFKDIGSVDYEINESFDSVGWYKLGKVLGEGYYGSVRMGSHARRGEKYAVKILKKSNINRFKDLKQIAEEIHVLKAHRHPNIIHLEEVVHAADNIYVVTELCSMDLHKYNTEIGLTMESAKQLVYGILRPLQHLHCHGICHLDLKPENILLKRSLEAHNAMYKDVRICDFGLAKMIKKSGESKDVILEGYACGTPGFYAPEMVLQEKFEGRTADMWSLGCIILEITLGFTQEWLDSYDHAEKNPAKFKRVLQSCLNEINIRQYPDHAKLLDLIHSCLSIDPSKRITSECALSHPWLKNLKSR